MERKSPIEEFVEQNPTVKNWLEEKAKRSKLTARQYRSHLYNYWLWLKQKGYVNIEQLLSEFRRLKKEDIEYRHNDYIKSYIWQEKKEKSKSNRDGTVSAIRSYYKHSRCPLPDEKIETTFKEVDKQRLREKASLKPMTLDDFRTLLLPMKTREKAIMLVLLQSGMGVGEFSKEFNVCTCRREWLQNGNGHVCEPHRVMKQLKEGKQYIKVKFMGRKSNPNRYFTYIGRDAIEELKRYLKFRAELVQKAKDRLKELAEKEKSGQYMQKSEKITLQKLRVKLANLTPEWREGQPVFISNYLNPVSSANIEAFVRSYKRVTGLTDREFTPHSCRDLFKTECSHVGVKEAISEFFTGHKLDAYGYNQLDKLYPEDFEKEYLKVESNLNILSHTLPKAEVDKVKEENLKLKEDMERLKAVVLALVNATKPTDEEFNATLKQFSKQDAKEKLDELTGEAKPHPKSKLKLP